MQPGTQKAITRGRGQRENKFNVTLAAGPALIHKLMENSGNVAQVSTTAAEPEMIKT